MNLSAPKQRTFLVAVVLAAIGLISFLVTIPVISDWDFWLVLIGFILLAAGTLFDNL